MTAKKLTRLTREQEALLPVIRDKWLRIGLQTGHGDVARAKAGVCAAYKEVGLAPPTIWIVLPSPLHGDIAYLFLRGVGDSVWDSVRDSVGDSVFGQHDAGWLSFYDTFHEFNIKATERLLPLMQVAEEMGWWWPFRGICILTHRPTALHRDERGRLHCETGSAIDYDGQWGIWAWHGVRVARDIIEKPELITSQRALAEPNAELRRVMMEVMGTERFFSELQPEILHHDMDGPGHPRRLLRIALPNDPEGHMVGVDVQDPSTGRRYILRVRPDVKTCAEAVASTFPGLPPGARYKPDVEA